MAPNRLGLRRSLARRRSSRRITEESLTSVCAHYCAVNLKSTLRIRIPRSHVLDFRFAAVVLRCAARNFKGKCEGFKRQVTGTRFEGNRPKSGNLLFKIYLHAPTQGCIATYQRIESVGLFLASFAGIKGMPGTSGTGDEEGKPLEKQKIAVSWRSDKKHAPAWLSGRALASHARGQ
jgi:hypothetical protein